MSRIHPVHSLPLTVEHLHGCTLTVGNFDGVHRGHQAILDRMRLAASTPNVPVVAVTFEPHPVRFFHTEHAPFRLTTSDQKLHLLSHYGVDAPIILKFDRNLSDLEPEAFVRKIICESFCPELVVVGYDFNFGKNRRGTPELVQQMLAAKGIACERQGAVEVGGEIVSSTRVRRAVASGEMKAARHLLGRPFAIIGSVTHGLGRGRSLGFPTANVEPDTERLPTTGVYVSLLEVGQTLWHAVTNIGVRPTFGGEEVTIETFVLDDRAPKDLDLYGEPVAVHLIERLRGEQKFDSSKALIEQIDRDVASSRELLARDDHHDVVRQVATVSAGSADSDLAI